MLQKGFLKSKEDTKNAGSLKRGRLFLFVGIAVVVLGMIFMMTNMKFFMGWMFMIIIGFCLAFVGLWMNFFEQKKNR